MFNFAHRMSNVDTKITRLFHRACATHHLLEDGDRILVALSGGKDSLQLVRLLAAQQRIHKPSIKVEAAHVIMDNIPYETDRSYLEAFCHDAGVELHVLHSSFDESTDKRKTHCFLCSWNRRKTLFNYAVSNSFNKIALGHHMDDVLTTMLMNITFEGSCSSMPPLLALRNYPLSIIRPLYLVHESMIAEVAKRDGFLKQKVLCPYEHDTQRTEMEQLFHHLEKLNPEARYSMMKALSSLSSSASSSEG